MHITWTKSGLFDRRWSNNHLRVDMVMGQGTDMGGNGMG